MMIDLTTKFSLALFLLIAAPGAFGESPDLWVDMSIKDAAVEIASPRVLVEDGAEASVSVSGEHPVAVNLVVRSTSADQAHIRAEVKTSGRDFSPELVVRKGEWARVSAGSLELEIRVEDHSEFK